MSKMSTAKYFLYIRKSTDTEDKQILSLEAQEAELLEFALREHLDVTNDGVRSGIKTFLFSCL